MARVKILVVTYRRPHLLRRALESIRVQSFSDWSCSVLNDDPDDPGPLEIVEQFHDQRIRMFEPQIRRGPARAFNEAFRLEGCEFCSLLEDDNWWEPEFLHTMIAALEQRPAVHLACSNERLWREESDGCWKDTSRTVWGDFSSRLYSTNPVDACGSAKICNSSMLWRQRAAVSFQTPDDIPVDVTEHFRERVIPQPILLLGRPLANFAITQTTNREQTGTKWGEYQVLLTGSCFASLKRHRRCRLAKELFCSQRGECSPRVTTLLMTGLAIPEARVLLKQANLAQAMRMCASLLRRASTLPRLLTTRRRHGAHWKFLIDSPLNRRFAESDGVY
jgi:hypothetical protein